jgi:predicted permease
MMGLEALFKFQAVTFIAIAFGLILRKLKLLDPKTANVLGDLIINLALPCSIVTSFVVKFDRTLVSQFLIALLIGTLAQVLAGVVNTFAYKKAEPEQQKILKYPTYVSNSGFLGLVIAGGMYPENGLMYGAIATVPLRIVMWSVALSLFTPAKNRKEAFIRVALHPCLIAVYIGLALLLTGYQPPALAMEALTSIGKTATPLSMILVGCLIAEISDFKTFFDKQVLWFSLLRLIILPAIIYAGCTIFGIIGILRGLSVIFAAMPAAVTTAVLASKYKSDTVFATKVVVISTLFSLATLPIWEIILLS